MGRPQDLRHRWAGLQQAARARRHGGNRGPAGTAPGAPDKGVAADAFDKLYNGSPGPGRETFDAQNFDAVMLCYLAAVAAGSTEGPKMAAEVRAVSGPPGKKYTWQQLPAAVNALRNGDDIDYEGASGSIDLDPAGDPTTGVYTVFRFQDGKVLVFDEVQVGEHLTSPLGRDSARRRRVEQVCSNRKTCSRFAGNSGPPF